VFGEQVERWDQAVRQITSYDLFFAVNHRRTTYMTTNELTERLDDLEAQLEDQQETIERQQERLEEQDAIIRDQRERLDEEATPASETETTGQDPAEPETPDDDSERPGPIATRRGVLTAGSVLGLLGLGAGTASADASGQIGTSSDPLKTLYTEELNGGVTGDTPLTNIAGSNLSIDNSGNLNATGGGSGSWVEGDNTNLLEPDSKDGIEVDTIADNGSGSVTMNSALDLTDNQINYGTNAGSQTLANLPFGSDTAGTTNSYAMQLNGDDVLTINGVNDGSGNLDSAYVFTSKELRLAGTLNATNGTIENTTGGLTVTTNDNGNLTLDPGSNNEVDVDNGGLDLNGNTLKSSSYGNVWDLRTSSNIGGSARTFALEINDDGSADNDITWQRAGNEDAAFRVVDRTNSNNLLTVNDGGDVDVHNGNLDVQSGTVENTTGDLTVTTNDNGNLTLDPGENYELNLSNQSTSSSGSLLAIDGNGNVVEASGTTLTDVGGGGSGAWVEGDNTNLLEPDTKSGIEVDTIADNGSTSVTMNATSLDLNGTMITDTSGNINLTPSSGNSIALGGDILSDTYNINTGTDTGTKIATATGQLLGFYDATPVAQQTGPSQLTDDTTGTVGSTLAPISGTGDDSAINNNLASIAADLETIRSALVSYGLLGQQVQ
jgi:hypothetical protein